MSKRPVGGALFGSRFQYWQNLTNLQASFFISWTTNYPLWPTLRPRPASWEPHFKPKTYKTKRHSKQSEFFLCKLSFYETAFIKNITPLFPLSIVKSLVCRLWVASLGLLWFDRKDKKSRTGDFAETLNIN